MKKYNSSANITDIFIVDGYSRAQTMVAVLKASGDNLTRENVMKQAASIHELKLPMLLPGITLSTTANDYAPIKQMQLERFDGATWKLFGEVHRHTAPMEQRQDRKRRDRPHQLLPADRCCGSELR
jgi:branched-chain amino acid transport system substrate-binding protein